MALLAMLAELALVRVILFMAADAIAGNSYRFPRHRLLMARLARQPGMRSYQFILGLGIMVELP